MALMVEIVGSVTKPTNLEEARQDVTWKVAMKVEYDSILESDTRGLVDLPPKEEVIGTSSLGS